MAKFTALFIGFLIFASCTKDETPHLQNGDEILEINGAPASDKEAVRKALAPKPGQIGIQTTFKVKGKDGKVYTKVIGSARNADGSGTAGAASSAAPPAATAAASSAAPAAPAPQAATPAPTPAATAPAAVAAKVTPAPAAPGSVKTESSSEPEEFEGNVTKPCPDLSYDKSGPAHGQK